jgi:hypothetical protein
MLYVQGVHQSVSVIEVVQRNVYLGRGERQVGESNDVISLRSNGEARLAFIRLPEHKSLKV